MKSVMNPPSTGPSTFANPNTDDRIPMYLPLSLGGKTSATTMNGMVMSIPPPIPWSPLKKVSSIMFWEKPQRTDVVINIIIPVIRNFLRPYISDNFPDSIIAMVDVKR